MTRLAKFIRRYDNNSFELFKNKLDCTDWNETTCNVDPNIFYDNLISKEIFRNTQLMFPT